MIQDPPDSATAAGAAATISEGLGQRWARGEHITRALWYLLKYNSNHLNICPSASYLGICDQVFIGTDSSGSEHW